MQYEFDGFPEAVSSVYTLVLAGLFCPTCPRTPRSFKAPLTPQGVGEMAMVAPCCHPLYGTACAVGLILQPLTGSSLCFSASVVILRVHKVGSSKEKNPQGWEKGVFERPRSFLFQVRVSSWVFCSSWASSLLPLLHLPGP